MPIKLLGVLIVALAFAAFTMPAAAMAEEVTLRGESEALSEGAQVTAFSSNLVFTSSSGLKDECAESEIVGEVVENPGAELEGLSSRFQGSGEAEACITNTGGRIETKIDPLLFRSRIRYDYFLFDGKKRVRADYFKDYYDRARSPNPIASCLYEGRLVSRFLYETPLAGEGSEEILPAESEFTLQEGSSGVCPASGSFSGNFEVTSEGSPVEVHP
jgi:hypothetical protein